MSAENKFLELETIWARALKKVRQPYMEEKVLLISSNGYVSRESCVWCLMLPVEGGLCFPHPFVALICCLCELGVCTTLCSPFGFGTLVLP